MFYLVTEVVVLESLSVPSRSWRNQGTSFICQLFQQTWNLDWLSRWTNEWLR